MVQYQFTSYFDIFKSLNTNSKTLIFNAVIHFIFAYFPFINQTYTYKCRNIKPTAGNQVAATTLEQL